MPLTIAPARGATDLAAIKNLFQEYAASLNVDLCFQGFEQELASLPGKYASPRGELLLAWSNGVPVGCVALRPLDQPGVCEMKRLYVSAAARGTGAGRALAEAIITFAQQAGYTSMLLDTLPSMQAAISLYRALGFREIPAYNANPVPGALFLQKPL